jgi:hypothetical protein
MMRCFKIGGLGGWRWVAAALLVATLVGASGCTRRFFRNKADKEVAEILAEKDVVPDWRIEHYHVYADPRARFADPSNPDRPPMPPDDPAARDLSPNPQKPPHKAGIAHLEGTGYLDLLAHWDAHNRGVAPAQAAAEEQEVNILVRGAQPEQPPEPRKLEMAPTPGRQPPYLITLEQAVELGLINSREYQTRREDLYLAALPVTRERFGFAFQFFALGEAIREWTGEGFPDGKGDRWRINSTAGFGKLFSTGALLLFSFANRTVIELSGRRDTTSVSTINLDLIQPLLRGGGRAVTLEPLTQVERNLLYEIREYARFRKEFFQYVSGGGDLISLGAASGFGTALTPGLISLATGNPARLEIAPGAAGRIDLGVGVTATSEGFLPTVQRLGSIKIEQDNIRRLEKILNLFKAYEEGDLVAPLQVGQVQLDLLTAQSRLLQERQLYGDALDRFKQQLGVPPPVPLELEQSSIKSLMEQYDAYERIVDDYNTLVKQMDAFDVRDAEIGKVRELVRRVLTESPLVKDTKVFRTTIEERWKRWQEPQLNDKQLGDALDQLRERRNKILSAQSDREAKGETLPPAQAAIEARALRDLSAQIALGEMEFSLRQFGQQLKKDPAAKDLELRALYFMNVRIKVVEVVGEASTERYEQLAPRWPTLPDVPVAGVNLAKDALDDALEAAVSTAIANRLDLMNARADVVDAWRQVAVFANSLLGVFNVGYHVDSSTPPGQAKPLAFQASQTRHQLFLNAELPLVRLVERNNYRAALIAFQRARRALMAAEDQVAAQVRAEVRQLQVLARNFDIQKKQVELQYQQVESSLATFEAPPEAPRGGAAAPTGGGQAGNIAALTQQLLNAYRGLPNNQRQLLTTWIQYQVARQQMYLDLELMPLDERGVWIDEHANRTHVGRPLADVERPISERSAAR